MANFIFNTAMGRMHAFALADPAKFGIILLKGAEIDGTLRDRLTLTTVLGSNTEANFTGYARKEGLTATTTVDMTNDRVRITLPSPQTWNPAGGAVDNSLVKFIVYYEVTATDSGRIPCLAWDYVKTTDGGPISVAFHTDGIVVHRNAA